MNSNGAGGKELLLAWKTSEAGWPTSWSPDGRFILYVQPPTKSMSIQDVWVLPLVGDRKPRLFVHNAFDGQFSPDGRWVSYTSIESGTLQIYVVPFDATKVLDTEPGTETSLTGKYQISASWRRYRPVARGRQGNLLFWAGQQMMAAEVDGRGNSFAARRSRLSSNCRKDLVGMTWPRMESGSSRPPERSIRTRRSPWCRTGPRY